MRIRLALALSLFAAVASAQEASSPELATPPPPPPSRGEAEAAEPPKQIVDAHSVGIHLGANVGLFAVDLHQGRFYGFVAGNVGVPLLSNGNLGAFVLGAGLSIPLSAPSESMWFLDLSGLALPGWSSSFAGSSYPYTMVRKFTMGLGVGAGFRYLHRSGFVLGFKAPIFGVGFGPGVDTTYGGTGQMVVAFYLSSIIALPVLSIGYRF